VIKLQFIRIKTELVYIDRRRTTSFNENDTWANKNCKSNKGGSSHIKCVTFWPILYNAPWTCIL